MKKGIVMLMLGLMPSTAVLADDVALTVYNQNLALVKEGRTLEFKRGVTSLSLTDVAAAIDSPEGRARAGLAAGQMHEQLGDRAAAIAAYEAALGAAREINRTSIVERAGASLNRLRETR